jgi:3-methyladenine DNA glycosylase/8-oxoguanine DNA glycosylase
VGPIGGVVIDRLVRVDDGYDLAGTLAPLRLGRSDLTATVVAGEVWRATRTPDGPATGRYCQRSATDVAVTAWGPGAAWLVEHAPALLGCGDDVSDFGDVARRHPVVHRVARERRGVRMPRSAAVYEALLPAVLSQKVTGLEAKRAWHGLVRRWGEPAPGPRPLWLPPDPAVLATVPYAAMHPLGVERKRAEVLRGVARVAARLDEAARMPLPEAHARLRAVPGIGAWTSAEVGRTALGDADAVSVGDFHLPHTVSWALSGQRGGDDARMLELLAPFAPHRGRVCRLLEMSGLFAPRRGPRLAPTPSLRPRFA